MKPIAPQSRSPCMSPSEPIRRTRIPPPTAPRSARHHRDFRLLCSLVKRSQRRRHLSQRRLGRRAARSISESRFGGAQSRLSAGELHHRQLRFPAALPATRNVVDRPHAQSGGKGYAITGHHEIMIPLLAAALIEADMTPNEPQYHRKLRHANSLSGVTRTCCVFVGMALPQSLRRRCSACA